MQIKPKKFSLPELGLEVEINKFARQAHGAAWIKQGKNVVLSTAVASESKEFMGFFPLTVEYREKASAAGKIPGGYVKREARLSDKEILTSRLIDRPIRPLFPANYFNEVQLLSAVYSADGSFPTGVLATIGSSLALTISGIPFLGPIGAVAASFVDGAWKFNPTYEEEKASDSNIIIAGTKAGICMVEGHCNSVPEEELVKVLFEAHEIIKKQVDWQLSIKEEIGKETNQPAEDAVDLDTWEAKIAEIVTSTAIAPIFGKDKADRRKVVDALKTTVLDKFSDEVTAGNVSSTVINFCFSNVIKRILPDIIAAKSMRVDGRKLDEVRNISTEVGLLPCSHGSAVFTRGETQALASITLGTAQDAQKVDLLHEDGQTERSFMLHYNFPPFSTGEARFMRAVSRREIGHGYLAETSFYNVLPAQDDFPYTIRSLVDVLESNGSSSMATVCSTTMALMDTGVPIKDMVAGIAMGLIKDSSSKYHVLTDILGEEDALGLMDFKVTGTEKGIMAFQLDIKDKVGLPRELFVTALAQAKTARLHILGEMKKVMTQPRNEVSELAPRVSSFKIPQDKIGAVIGPAGKNIKEIVAQTETQVDIDDDGTVRLYAKSSENAKSAERWIRILIGEIETDSVFDGIVRRVVDFGIFVELVPGKEGLIHISTIAKNRQPSLGDDIKNGDKLIVKVAAYDKDSGRIRLVAPDLKSPK